MTPQKWTARLALRVQRHKPWFLRKAYQMSMDQLIFHSHLDHRHLHTKTVRAHFHRLAALQITYSCAQHNLVPTQIWNLLQRYHFRQHQCFSPILRRASTFTLSLVLQYHLLQIWKIHFPLIATPFS